MPIDENGKGYWYPWELKLPSEEREALQFYRSLKNLESQGYLGSIPDALIEWKKEKNNGTAQGLTSPAR